MCKADSETKAFRSEKKGLCKNVARGSDSTQPQRQPARSLPGLCVYSKVEKAVERWSRRDGQGQVAMGPGNHAKEWEEKREVRKKLKAQAYCSDYSGFKSQRPKPKRECTGCVTGKCRRLDSIIRIFCPFPHPHTHFLCWLPSLTASFHTLASGNSSFVMNG